MRETETERKGSIYAIFLFESHDSPGKFYRYPSYHKTELSTTDTKCLRENNKSGKEKTGARGNDRAT